MPRIMLNDFVEVVKKSGLPKVTKVAQIKNRDVYSPMTDFYKPLRDEIVELHKKNGDKTSLTKVLNGLSDPKKQANYPAAISGYQKWWGKKKLEWFQPSNASYAYQGIEVSLNPELGLRIDGQPHILKLYLKDEKLPKAHADIITGLMELGLRSKFKDESINILDVRNAKTFAFGEGIKRVQYLINSELSFIATLWNEV